MPYEYKAKVTEIYDGDTVTVDIDLGFRMWVRGEKVRLLGINAPELRGETYTKGLYARDYLRNLILGREITLVTKKDSKEKYGRYLGTIYLYDERQNINEEMVRSGHAVHADY